VSAENPTDGRSVYLRLALLIVGWAIAGLLLYFLSTFLPIAIMGVIVCVAWAIVRFDSRRNKSLGSLLCAITCSLTGVCAIAMRFTRWHEDVMARLIFVGLCLGAGLIVLDRRADDWQS
jgi:hypothetical protein